MKDVVFGLLSFFNVEIEIFDFLLEEVPVLQLLLLVEPVEIVFFLYIFLDLFCFLPCAFAYSLVFHGVLVS